MAVVMMTMLVMMDLAKRDAKNGTFHTCWVDGLEGGGHGYSRRALVRPALVLLEAHASVEEPEHGEREGR
eukprot:9492526-Pyramimonas_sp.AAC.1